MRDIDGFWDTLFRQTPRRFDGGVAGAGVRPAEPEVAVEVCMGRLCAFMGGRELAGLREYLPAEVQYRVRIEAAGCLDVCRAAGYHKAPYVRVNGIVYGNMTPENLAYLVCGILKAEPVYPVDEDRRAVPVDARAVLNQTA